MQIYRELFPDDKDIKPEDLKLFRVDRILTNHPYNDLGLLARQKLIVLAEAETEWSENIIYRLAVYYFQSMEDFIYQTGMNVHNKAKINLLDVEAFVIYPGKRKIKKAVISLRDEFFNGDPRKPDFKAKIIYGDYKGGIIEEYITFCRIFDKQRSIHKDNLEPQKWIAATVDICIKQNVLADYLKIIEWR